MWAHGWGQDHASMKKLAEALSPMGRHILYDLPGFGGSDKPETDWSTQDYSDALVKDLRQKGVQRCIWIGHSFGGRIGIQAAARYPQMVKHLVLIAGAGLQKKRTPPQALWLKLRVSTYKILRLLIRTEQGRQWLRQKFGSSDYKNAGEMRGIFLNVIREDLSPLAKQVICPATLIYGDQDTETPAEFGVRYKNLMQDAALFVLEGEDHYSVLGEARHQVLNILSQRLATPEKTPA